MSFTYSRDIPFSSHNPSSDQPIMQTNTNSIDDLIKVDHVSFNDGNAGKHLHLTFPAPQSDPTLTPAFTQIYPKAFASGANTYLETYTAANTQGNVTLNGYLPFVKCIGRFTGVTGPYPQAITPASAIVSANIGSISQTSTTTIKLTFSSPVPSGDYIVFNTGLSSTLGAPVTVTKTAADITFHATLGTLVGIVIEIMVI